MGKRTSRTIKNHSDMGIEEGKIKCLLCKKSEDRIQIQINQAGCEYGSLYDVIEYWTGSSIEKSYL